MIRKWHKSTRIALVVMVSLMMVVSSFAPVCTAFAEEGTGDDQIGTTEIANEKNSGSKPKEQKQEQKQETKEETKETKEVPGEETKEEPKEETNGGTNQGTNKGSRQEQAGSNNEITNPSANAC